jgi:hypothetical protein
MGRVLVVELSSENFFVVFGPDAHARPVFVLVSESGDQVVDLVIDIISLKFAIFNLLLEGVESVAALAKSTALALGSFASFSCGNGCKASN